MIKGRQAPFVLCTYSRFGKGASAGLIKQVECLGQLGSGKRIIEQSFKLLTHMIMSQRIEHGQTLFAS